MAIYHFSCKTISRSAGRSATAAAAYRSAERIRDLRTGEDHDYSRKRGVEYREIVLPDNAPAWASNREQLWNAAEAAETRKNSTVAREFEFALPAELSPEQQRALAVGFARELVDRHGCAVDVAIHAPHREGDMRNHHAHLLCSTRRLTAQGFKDKTRELDNQRSGEIPRWRARWATLQNEHLEERGHSARVDHRSLEDQGIDREPARHRGAVITALERRGAQSRMLQQWAVEERQEIMTRLQRAAELGRLEREDTRVAQSILDLSNDLAAARLERDASLGRQVTPQTPEQVQSLAKTIWQQARAQETAQARNKIDLTRGRGLGHELPGGPDFDH